MFRIIVTIAALALVTGCNEEDTAAAAPESAAAAKTAGTTGKETLQTIKGTMSLSAALEAQPDESQQRYRYRHPKETLEFFGIQPGMTVVEALPGSGWYSKILIPYLGPQGHLIGADYAQSMFPKFGFFDDKFIEAKKTWVEDWSAEANGWYGGAGAKVSAFAFGSMPSDWKGKADAVLLVRALHNLARFENDGEYMTTALGDVYDALKPGGIVGVVQHMAPEDSSDEWADGSKGYLKKAFVIEAMEAAGFELVAESGINHNHNDKPTEADFVWRLPPTLVTSREDPELREQMEAIGESHRMTLKFRKPI